MNVALILAVLLVGGSSPGSAQRFLPHDRPRLSPLNFTAHHSLRLLLEPVKVGKWLVNWDNATLQLTARHEDSALPRPAWGSVPGEAFLVASSGLWNAVEHDGSFSVTDDYGKQTTLQTIEAAAFAKETGALTLGGTLSCRAFTSSYNITFRTSLLAGHTLAVEATIGAAAAGDKAKPYRAILRTATLDGERFFGLGEQYTYWDIAGRRVPIIAEEVRSRVCLCVVSCVCVVCVKVRGYV